MTHYLRTQNNKTVVDVETSWPSGGDGNIQSVVIIEEYTKILLSTNQTRLAGRQKQCIEDFTNLQNLRGEWFETPLAEMKESPDEFVTRRFREIGKRWDLHHVTD